MSWVTPPSLPCLLCPWKLVLRVFFQSQLVSVSSLAATSLRKEAWKAEVVCSSPLWSRTSLVAQMIKRLPAMQETRIQSLDWEDPLEKKWPPTPVFLPGESHGWRSLVGYTVQGVSKESDTTERLHFLSLFLWSSSLWPWAAPPERGPWV